MDLDSPINSGMTGQGKISSIHYSGSPSVHVLLLLPGKSRVGHFPWIEELIRLGRGQIAHLHGDLLHGLLFPERLFHDLGCLVIADNRIEAFDNGYKAALKKT